MASIDNFNGVRSNLVDQGIPQVTAAFSPNSIFIFGTAKSGPVNQPIRVNPTDSVVSLVGDVVTYGLGFETSLPRGYFEFSDASAGQQEVVLVRVGETSKSSIRLYENETVSSGEVGATIIIDEDGTQHPAYSLTIQSASESSLYNGSIVRVIGDDNGNPAALRIELTDGTIATYQISQTYNGPNVITKVSDLVNRINATSALAGKIIADYDPIEKTYEITVNETDEDVKVTTYDISGGTYGDKIVGIKQAYVEGSVVQNIAAGSLTATLSAIPEKSMEEATPTITSFTRHVLNESVLTVAPTMVGATNKVVFLSCVNVSSWDSTDGLDNVVVKVKRNGTDSFSTLTVTTDYTVNESAGTITILGPLAVGDRYFVSYDYSASYTEVKLRSEIPAGNDSVYFIGGDVVIFGAAQPFDITIGYSAKRYINLSKISLVDKVNGIIDFLDASELPDVGSKVTLVFTYEPELPAITGTVLSTGQIQPGSMSGGSDGIPSSLLDYKRALQKAFEAVDLYPRRHNIVMGMYLDDVENGYNENTGLPESVPVAIHDLVIPFVERSSVLANECDVAVPVRPLANITPAGISQWITKLTVPSTTDPNRPANIIAGIENFRVDAPVGCFVYKNTNINGGKEYFANPATIYVGFKSGLNYTESAVHKQVPSCIRDLGVKIFNADIISALNANKYTAAVMNASQQFIWADAPTVSRGSQFSRQFVRDTTFLAIALAREAAAPYIGKPRQSHFLTSMRKDIYKAVTVLLPDAIGSAFVELLPISDGYITGHTAIRLILDIAVEITRVDIITYVNPLKA